ncbi:MAG: hypothetical protein M1827_004102 [Pycnora praestabilis]|nr:MAG: hypothetical protein M1827_004102 [Pycnora praestabilis]
MPVRKTTGRRRKATLAMKPTAKSSITPDHHLLQVLPLPFPGELRHQIYEDIYQDLIDVWSGTDTLSVCCNLGKSIKEVCIYCFFSRRGIAECQVQAEASDYFFSRARLLIEDFTSPGMKHFMACLNADHFRHLTHLDIDFASCVSSDFTQRGYSIYDIMDSGCRVGQQIATIVSKLKLECLTLDLGSDQHPPVRIPTTGLWQSAKIKAIIKIAASSNIAERIELMNISSDCRSVRSGQNLLILASELAGKTKVFYSLGIYNKVHSTNEDQKTSEITTNPRHGVGVS